MELEAGPLEFLDPDRVLPPRRTYGFETLAAQAASQVDGAVARVTANASIMLSDLGSSPTAGLDGPLERALAEHNSQVGGAPITFGDTVSTANDLGDELDFVRSHFPPEGTTPPLPNVTRNEGNVFEGAEPAEAPPPTGGGGGGGDDSGGGGGGGGGGGDSGYEGEGDPRIDEAARILRSLAAEFGATMERSDPRLLVEKADGIDRYGGSLSAASVEFRDQYRRRGGG